MSTGTVYHKKDDGEMIYYTTIGSFVCEKCGTKWDGSEPGIVSYFRSTEEKQNDTRQDK